jgi:hypothetical protein
MCRLQAARELSDDIAGRDQLIAEARFDLEGAVAGLEATLGAENRQTMEAAAALCQVEELAGDAHAAALLRERFSLPDR